MKELIFLNPVIIERIWGREYWVVSAHPNGDCTVKGGTYDGMKLSTLWKEHKELFSNIKSDEFPLLVKIIDAKEDLSIQVHPDNNYAMIHENGAKGKTECWYVMDCKDDGTIIIGHNAKNIEELSEMIHENKWDDLLREIPVKKGDFFQIVPGTIHAIKEHTKILEIQQSSDITYRLYDYGRLQNGKPRELHIGKSMDVINSPFSEAMCYIGEREERIVACPYYSVNRYEVDGSEEFWFKLPFVTVSIIEGSGFVDGIPIKEGETFLVPYVYGKFTIEGRVTMMVSGMSKLYGALEADGEKMLCAVGYADGTILEKKSFPTRNPKETVEEIVSYFADKNIAAIGIGSFGRIDVERFSDDYGKIMDASNIQWKNINLRKVLQDELNVPIMVDTNVNAACLGEMTFGCAKGLDSVLYLNIGTFIEAGISANGQLIHGMLHPEVGHILLTKHPNDKYEGICPFHTVCLEGMASDSAIEGRWGRKSQELSKRAEVWEMEAFYIAQALANFVYILAPRRIVLGGEVMKQEQLFPLIREKTADILGGYFKTDELKNMDDYIVPASLNDDQGIMGAIQLAVWAEERSN